MTIDRTQLLIGGGVIFWRLASKFDHNLLANKLKDLGLQKYCPEVRTHESALREALKENMHDLDGNMVRGLKNPKTDGYVVVLEEVGEIANTYQPLFTAKVDEHGSITVNPHSQNMLGELYVSFNKHKGTVPSSKVAKSLVDILEHLGATSLRDGGGFYWLHEDRLDEWRSIAEAVEQCVAENLDEDGKQKTECAIYMIRTQIDNLSARALKDAIVAEVKKRSDEIKEQANRPGLKSKAFVARQKEAQALHDRVKYFEDLLGEGLRELHDVADVCENEVVESALQQIPDFLGALGDVEIQEVA